ncbi:hypothetical protein [Streptomyces sp. NBC_01751]|uniref:hypothetical protein n=1 Tax=Streptomyces sp. NBC_01751 TaxID=2975929 RepID=UPI002DD7DE8C|nr:hypothetical protein [Streptomyces sp. NBC_01751]WSD28871.1 hypothetical protein OHA26_38490 [Streptomyces sp. NBC_01751]
MDDLAEFTGDFVLNIDRAWALVRNFVQAEALNDLGQSAAIQRVLERVRPVHVLLGTSTRTWQEATVAQMKSTDAELRARNKIMDGPS